MNGKDDSPVCVFRADASLAVGSGHVRRCLALAAELARRGARVLFLSRARPSALTDDIAKAGFGMLALPELPLETDGWLGTSEEEDARQTIAAVAGLDVAVLIADSYGIGAIWEALVRPHVGRLAVFDDLADRPHVVDVLVDPTPAPADRYAGLVPAEASLLCGAPFALLDARFRAARKAQPSRDGVIRRALVSFGAVDREAHGLRAASAIRAVLGPEVQVDLVLGSGSPHLAEAQARAASDPSLSLHVDTSDMPGLMMQADLAIGAGGTTSWERACLGLPALVCAIADNQRLVLRTLVEAGAALSLPADERFEAATGAMLGLLAGSAQLLVLMSRAASALVDGRGAIRVADHLLPVVPAIRAVTAADREQIWSWRNEPDVRMASLDPSPIPWDSHCRWFDRILGADDVRLLVGEVGGQPIGVVRFDLGHPIRVSVYLSPQGKGQGHGARLLAASHDWMRQRGHAGVVRAEIRTDNLASVAAFEAAGYRPALLIHERTL